MKAVDEASWHHTDRRGRLDRVLPWLAVPAIAGIAAMLWAWNGPRVFSEMLSAAWALCF